MKFLENIKSSIYNPVYYKEILNKPFSYSLRYFFSLAILISAVSTLIFSFSVLPKFNKFVNEGVPKILTYYPDNLEVTAKAGKISTNVPEPFFVKMPTDPETDTAYKTGEVENLLVIDTASPLTIDLFNKYKTIILVSRDSIAYQESIGTMKIQSLDQSINGVVTKTKFSEMLNQLMPYLKISSFILAPVMFIFLFVGFIVGNLIYLIFGAFVIWLTAQAMKKNLGYGKSYQIGVHAITLGAILDATLFTLEPSLELLFLPTILMLAIVWINLKFSPSADNSVGSIETGQKLN